MVHPRFQKVTVKPPKKGWSHWDNLTRVEKYETGLSAEMCRMYLRIEGNEIDKIREWASDEHWGKCSGEHVPKKCKK